MRNGSTSSVEFLKPPRRFALLVLPLILSFLGGCAACVPDKVALGVTRLTMRQAAVISRVLEDDKHCGFSSDAVLRGVLVQGQLGQLGALTYTVTDCKISFPELTVISHDCVGSEASVVGEFTVSATKHIAGTITGDEKKPIIPAGDDAVDITVNGSFSNFHVAKNDSPNSLTIESGKLSFVISPRLALSAQTGLCTKPARELSFREVRYQDAKIILSDGKQQIPVDVPTSDLTAQAGKWRDEENSFSGTVTVWDSAQRVSSEGIPLGLDVDYTAPAYFDSIACDEELVKPISYACPSLKENLLHGAARLSVNHFGTAASLIDKDTSCGFSSAPVLANAQVSGSTGGPGSVTLTLPAPCTITLATPTAISTDCNGVEKRAQGTVTITGTKTLTGILTGDPAQPIAPNTRDPATLSLTQSYTQFKVSDSQATRALTAIDGTLSGTLKPRVAIDSRTGFCSLSTPIAQFSHLQWRDATLSLFNDGLTFEFEVSSGTLDAQNGSKGEQTNYLAGTLISDGIPVTLPPAGLPPTLDPKFDALAFEQTFRCTPGLQLAPDDAACSIEPILATNAGRLLMQTAGALASLVQNDSTCGFAALSVKTNPSRVEGSNGNPGLLEWNLTDACTLGSASGVVTRSTDCLGVQSLVSGTADVLAQRIVTGIRDTQFVIFDSIIPNSRDSLSITLRNTQVNGFAAYTLAPSETAPAAKLVLLSGTLSGTVIPGLGERRSKAGVFDIPTPVATFTDIQLHDATAQLEVGSKRFLLSIPAAQLSALNGSLKGQSNSLSGTVVLGQSTVTIPAGTKLNPNFNQDVFDSSYSCTADLATVVPPN